MAYVGLRMSPGHNRKLLKQTRSSFQSGLGGILRPLGAKGGLQQVGVGLQVRLLGALHCDLPHVGRDPLFGDAAVKHIFQNYVLLLLPNSKCGFLHPVLHLFLFLFLYGRAVYFNCH